MVMTMMREEEEGEEFLLISDVPENNIFFNLTCIKSKKGPLLSCV